MAGEAGASPIEGQRAADRLAQLFGDEARITTYLGQATVEVPTEQLAKAALELHSHSDCLYEMPVTMTCVDWPEREPRFDVIYVLRSLVHNDLARLQVRADEGTELPSLSSLYPGLGWHERECYDLFGIRFSDHPDLTRILLPDDWEGHPLRKDYVSFGEPVAFTHNIEWALSPQDRPEYMPGAVRGSVERP
ncbi:MAG: NADH-quinone oxidoreductase subunit C [Candidatus Dormiibacterota bacterium]